MRLTTLLLLLAGAAGANADTDPVTTGEWKIASGDDPLNSGMTASLQQASATTIKDENGAEVTPLLAFSCAPGDAALTARIEWRRFISSFSTEVGFKVDGGRFAWLKWKVDPGEKITFSADTGKLIELLAAGEDLLVEVSPYSQAPVTARFDLRGLGEGLAALRKQCT